MKGRYGLTLNARTGFPGNKRSQFPHRFSIDIIIYWGMYMALQQSDLKHLQVRTSETFSIHLWEDRTRGEQWVPTYDANVFALIGDDFLRTISNNAVDSGRRSFEFQALKPGKHRIEFSKRMAWKFTAEDRRVFDVTVVSAF